MSEQPLVSVIIPTYDRPKLLSRAVQSVAKQTYENIELIIVDDCSPESCREEIEDSVPSEMDHTFHRHDENRGHAAARNTGMELAAGDFLAFLDDDDEWLECKVEKQVMKFLQESDSVGVVYTGIRQVQSNGSVNAITTPSFTGDVTKQLLVDDFIGTGSMYMIRSEAYDTVGGFDERLPAWVDWDYSLRLSQEYEFAAVTEPLVNRYVGGHKQSSDDYEIRRDSASELFLDKHRSIASEYGVLMERKMLASVEFYLAQSAYTNGLYGTARTHVIRAVLRYPLNPTYFIYFGILSGGKYTFNPLQAFKRRITRILYN